MTEKYNRHTEVERGCCVDGRWGYPSNENPQEWLTVYELAERYLREVHPDQSLEDVHPVKYEFHPHDTDQYSGTEADNIRGVFHLWYTLVNA